MADTAWGGAWGGDGGAWGAAWVIAADLSITDTDILQLPVNAVLADVVPIKDRYREFDIRPMRLRDGKVRLASRGSATRISGDPPSFTVSTSKRGHD